MYRMKQIQDQSQRKTTCYSPSCTEHLSSKFKERTQNSYTRGRVEDRNKKSKTLLPLLPVGSFAADETLAQPLQRQLRPVAVKATDFALPEVPRIAFETLPEIGFLQELRVTHPTATVLADARFLAGRNRFAFGAGGVVLGAPAAEPDFRTGLEPGRVMTFDCKGHGGLPLERTEGGGG